MGMPFVFDAAKSASNRIKHGIDFVEAQALWRDPRHLVLAARAGHEERFLVVGRVAGKHWSAVVTYRGDLVRIISVRRSRRREVGLYEGE
jgi:hypothetical protein